MVTRKAGRRPRLGARWPQSPGERPHPRRKNALESPLCEKTQRLQSLGSGATEHIEARASITLPEAFRPLPGPIVVKLPRSR